MLVGIASPVLLIELRIVFEADPGASPFLLFGLVVVTASWIGGLDAGLAAMLSFLATSYSLLAPPWDWKTLVVALVEGTLMSWLGSTRLKAILSWTNLRQELEQRIDRRTSQLARTNVRLQEEVEAHELTIGNLVSATGQLTSSNKELELFASAASHDLQEPLRKIRTFADRLLNRHAEGVSDAARDDLARIARAAERMSTLIEGLLAYSRLARQSGIARQVDLDEVVRGVLSDLALLIESGGARVEVGPLPTIEADEVQMRQLFQNLISNALKFVAPEAPAEIRVHGEVDPSAVPPFCRLFVADRGIGFEPRYREKVFDMFQRLHERGRYEGSGIGLAICRKIVERHGGTIEVSSEVGRGSTFVVTLPLEQPAPAATEIEI